jgi:hypothetical protein
MRFLPLTRTGCRLTLILVQIGEIGQKRPDSACENRRVPGEREKKAILFRSGEKLDARR